MMFKNRLKTARTNAGYSQKALAERLYISQPAYAQYESGQSSPNPEMLAKIADYLGVSVDYLLGRSDYPDAPESTGGVWVPVLGTVAAGTPITAVENIIDYEEISLEMSRKGEHYGLKIKGDSMYPQICDGDTVIVRQQQYFDNGDICVVLINGDEATVKKIQKISDGLLLIPYNRDCEQMFFTPDEVINLPVQVIGKVVELRRSFR